MKYLFVEDMSLNLTTMDDVFLKIGEMTEDKLTKEPDLLNVYSTFN